MTHRRLSSSHHPSLSCPVVLALALVACGGDPVLGASDLAADAGPVPSPSGAPSPATPLPDVPAPTGAYFPPAEGAGAWAAVSPSTAGWDEGALAEVRAWVGETRATSFVVLSGGKILVEDYWGADASTKRDIASAQKSVVSLLAGRAMSEGALSPDATVSSLVGAGWSNDTPANESAITVRHLLTMTSGLDDSLVVVAAPGSTWRYNTNAYHVVGRILEAKTGKSLQDLTRSALFDPIGAGASAWTTRPLQKDGKGNPIRALEMTARDMARVGLLVEAEGTWNMSPVVPANYLSVALASSQSLNPSYGFLFWLNGKASYLVPGSQAPVAGSLVPSAPADLVAALGAFDQKIYVSRSTGLVVVRQGAAAAQGTQALSDFDDLLWRRLLAARKAK